MVKFGLNLTGFKAEYNDIGVSAAKLIRGGAYEANDADADWLRNNIKLDARTGRSSMIDTWLAELERTTDTMKGKQLVRVLVGSMTALKRHAGRLQDAADSRHLKAHPAPAVGQVPPPAPGEPCAKIVSMNLADRHGGPAEVFVNRRGSSGSMEQGKVGTLLCLGDKVQTGPNAVCAIEFLIGGRTALTKNTAVEVLDERSVGGQSSVKSIILKAANLWVKADAKQLKQPLEIQTNGGVMGIKG